MSLAPSAPTVMNRQQQAVSGLNIGTSSSGVASAVRNHLRAPLQELQDHQLGPATSQLQTSVVTQDALLNYIQQNANDGSRNPTTSTPQLSSMLPPPLPSQPLLNKTSPSSDLIIASESASQNRTPSASAPQLTQPSHISSQTYTAPSSSQASSVRQDNMDAQKAASPAPDQETTMYPVLKEPNSLYDLPLDVLERAIGDIIREDGFIPLVSLHAYFLYEQGASFFDNSITIG